jgi:hypothetical protein
MDRPSLPERSRARLRRRVWPLVVTGALVSIGMAYSLAWGPVVDHHSFWYTPGDLWATYRSAHYIGWGYLGGVYSAGTGLVTFPGILLVLAPVAMFTGGLGLTEAFPRYVTHPSAWLVLGPYEMLVSAIALFACDSLAERLGVGRGRRVVLCVAEAVVLWNVSVMWGHPEDAVAIGLAVYALVLALDGRWTGAGWLFGAALATQPLVVLMFPVLLALGGRRHAAGLSLRSVAPAVALLITPLVSQFHVTMHALLDQPNYPGIDHATPWTTFAPVLGGSGRDLAVAAGPGRVVAVVLACCLGWWARRWRQRPDLIVWAAALALALRCLTESVMVAFYVWPALALALVVAARAGRARLAAAAVLALGTTIISDQRWGELPWWAAVTTGILAVLLVGVHRDRRAAPLDTAVGAAEDLRLPDQVPQSAVALVGAAP